MRIHGERDEPHDDLPWPLLDRYLTDRLSEQDRLELEGRLAVHPEWRAALADVRAFVRAPMPVAPPDGDALWAAMEHRIAVAAPRRRLRWVGVAEVGAIAAGLIVAAVLLGRHRVPPSVVGGRDTVSSIVASVTSPETVAAEPVDTEPVAPKAGLSPRGGARVATAERIRRVAAVDERALEEERNVSLADERPGAADTRWP